MSCGILGEKLSHSFSPLIYNEFGIDDYSVFEVPPEDLGGFLRGFKGRALSVTIPYKKAVIEYCSSLSDIARRIGGVNLLLFDGKGGIHGHNTDYAGFLYMASQAGVDFAGKKVLILGSGGVALAVEAAMKGCGAREAVFISRSGENNYVNLGRHADADIIVNATPVGMYPHSDAAPVSLDMFKGLCGVLDLIYNPLRTRLVLEATERGIPCCAGLSMLVEQARLAASSFGSRELPEGETPRVLALLRRRLENIAIIGMPGSGKSAAAGELAKKMGRSFADSDLELERSTGKSASQWIIQDGEDVFREKEVDIICSLASRQGLVLATGGGVPLREDNRRRLCENSRVYLVTRPIDELETKDRPLSADLQSLQRERDGAYRLAADVEIDAGGKSAGEIADLILEDFDEYTGA